MSARLLSAAARGGSPADRLLAWLREPQNEDDMECSKSAFALYFMKYLKTQTQQYLQPEESNSISSNEFKSFENSDPNFASKSMQNDDIHRVNIISTTPLRVSAHNILQNGTDGNYPCHTADDNMSDKENICILNKTAPVSVAADFISHQNNVSTSNEDKVCNSNFVEKNTSKYSESDASLRSADIYVTPQKLQSFDNSCLFSPVTPVNTSISPSSDNSFIRYSTPNTNRPFNRDSSQKKTTVSPFDGEHLQIGNAKKNQKHTRTNICIGDFLPGNKSNANDNISAKKNKNFKYRSLSMNDPMLNSNKENARHDSGNRYNRYAENFNIEDKSTFPDIGVKKNNSGSKSNSRGQTRRINPTRLNVTFPCPDAQMPTDLNDGKRTDVTFGLKYDKSDQNDAFKVQNCQIVENSAGFKTERDMLRKEKVNLIEKFNEISSNAPKKIVTTVPVSPKPLNKPTINKVHFNVNSVHHNEVLNIFASIFATLLDCNLVSNVTSEIYYLISLAILKQTMKKSDDKKVAKKELINDNLSTSSNVSDVMETDDEVMDNLFDSVDNCIYFALTVLEKQKHLLSVILDNNCLRFLLSSQRIRSFSIGFVDFLSEIYAKKLSAEDKSKDVVISEGISNKNVCFITDTDSVDNFPSRKSFLSFKRLRDGFYELLRTWENDHNKHGWTFHIQLGPKVRSLLLMGDCPSNFAHLARLFKLQLLTTCAKPNSSVETIAHLQSVIGGSGFNHNRISKLAERLTGTLPGQKVQSDQNELSSRPDFSGREEFFRDFILHGLNSSFREHLIDSLTEEIQRLDETGFLPSDNEEFDDTIDQETKTQYLICVRSLRVLAKFLGYLISLPYCPIVNYSGNFYEKEIAVRNQLLPPINLIVILHNSQRSCRLILTIPWMCQLLAMLDHCSLRLIYFEELINSLFTIYASCTYNNHGDASISKTDNSEENYSVGDDGVYKMPFSNSTLIRICLGWLFDMEHFPKEFFNTWVDRVNKSKDTTNTFRISNGRLNWIKHSNDVKDSTESSHKSDNDNPSNNCDQDIAENKLNDDDIKKFFNLSLEAKSRNLEFNLDSMQIVDDYVVKDVCPFLKEFRALILRNQSKSHVVDNSRNARHITPVTSSIQGDTHKRKDKELQMRLEEWFMRSQPGTIQRIIELVGDRTGSALVRLAKAQLSVYSKSAYDAALECVSHLDKDSALIATTEVYNNKLAEFHVGCRRAGQHVALKRARGALQSLLPPGTATAIFDVCAEICTRNALKRLNHFLQTQFNTIKIFSNNIQEDVKKVLKTLQTESRPETPLRSNILNTSLLVNENEISHNSTEGDVTQESDINDAYISPTMVLIDLKESLVKLLNATYDLNQINSDVHLLLRNITECCKYPYVDKFAKGMLIQLSLDLTIFLICVKPNILDEAYLDLTTKAWSACLSATCEREDASSDGANEEIKYFRHLMDPNILLASNNSQNDSSKNVYTVNQGNLSGDFVNNSVDDKKIASADNDMEEILDTTISDVQNGCFNTVMCSRNIMMIGGFYSDVKKVERWRALAKFIMYLLKNDYLSDDSFTEQCLALYQQDWPQEVHEGMATCIRDITDQYKFPSKPKLCLLLDFLSDFCQHLDDDFSGMI